MNTTTGAGTAGPALTGAPEPASMNSMTFIGATLYAVNSNNGGVATTHLVTINTATGAVTDIGALPNDTDAIAFGAAVSPASVAGEQPVPALGQWALVLTALLLGALGAATIRARRK